MFYGGGLTQLGKQALGMVVVAIYAFAVSYALARLINHFMGFRLTAEEETTGVDFTQHAETAYAEGVHGHQPMRRPLFGEGRPDRTPTRTEPSGSDCAQGMARPGWTA